MLQRDETPVILIREYSHQVYAEFIKKEADRYGWRLFNVATAREIIPPFLNLAGAFLTWGLRDPLSLTLENRGVPHVRIGNFPEDDKRKMPSILIDHVECGRLAAKYYADRGFAHFGYVGNDPWGNGRDVYQAFNEKGISLGCKTYLFRYKSSDPQTYASNEAWFQSQAREIGIWLRTLPKPIGLLTFSERVASRLSAYILEEGFNIPEDVALLSIGNHPFFTDTAAVPVSSIELPWDKMWEKAFSCLKSIIEGVGPNGRNYLIPPTKIMERKSTDIRVVGDPLVAKSLRFIWDNYDKNISVDDLIELTKVSRSTLQRAFKLCLRRGFNEELRRKRLEVAGRMLLNSQRSVTKIAEEVGFNTLHYFHRAFLEKFGMTPSVYRKQKVTKNT